MQKIQNLWLCTENHTSYPKLQESKQVDVAIVGGGITGITAAWILKKAGKKVALLEKNRLMSGETGFTTAHITEILDTPYQDLMQRFGIEKMRQVVASKRASIRKIASIIRELNIACEFEFVPGFRYAESKSQIEELRMEVMTLKMLGVSAELVSKISIPYAHTAALHVPKQAQFNPVIYARAIAEKIPGEGSFIFENSLVSKFDENENRLETDQGTIYADNVIWATNVPVSNRVFIQTKLAAYRSYAIAALAEKNLEKGLFWDMQDPYHYIRTQKINYRGTLQEFLIIGGEDHKTGKEENTFLPYERLEDFASNHFGPIQIPFRWSGQIIESVDGLPYIGLNAFSKHFYIATGFSGNGITFGTLSAMILSDLILGRPNEWVKIYSPSRVTLSAAPNYLSENKDFPTHLACDFLAHHPDKLSEIPAGEGRLIGEGHHCAAVYRDQQGELHGFSAICPHLGCLINWNKAERSWDCPCHGSRFDCRGNVLNGPAHTGLKPIAAEKLHTLQINS